MGTFFHKDKRPKAKAGTKGDDKKTKGGGKRPNEKGESKRPRATGEGKGPRAKKGRKRSPMNNNADQNEGPIAKKTIGTFFHNDKRSRMKTKSQGRWQRTKGHR